VSAIALAAFFATVFVNKLIPGPVLFLVLARTASAGQRAGVSTVLGIVLAQIATLLAALAAISVSMNLSGLTQSMLRAGGMVLLVWLAWRVWNMPCKDRFDASVHAREVMVNDCAKGMLAGLSSPYNLFLMLAVLPSLVDPAQMTPAQVLALVGTYLVATLIPLSATIWAGIALHEVWARHDRVFARTGAVMMLGFAGAGFLEFA
jgi:threonine/homoserine/homoserine lactone efflux protein